MNVFFLLSRDEVSGGWLKGLSVATDGSALSDGWCYNPSLARVWLRCRFKGFGVRKPKTQLCPLVRPSHLFFTKKEIVKTENFPLEIKRR